MKKILNLEAPKLIFRFFIIAVVYVLLYEFVFMNYPSDNEKIYKLGVFFSRLGYSAIATSVFYYISQYFPIYLPKQKKKISILSILYYRTRSIETLINDLGWKLNIQQEAFRDIVKFNNSLKKINPNLPVTQFENWPHYFFYLRTELLEIIRTITQYEEYLSTPFLHELIILEDRLFSKVVFSGMNSAPGEDLTYALIPLQELLIHNHNLEIIREAEFAKYKEKFDKIVNEYRSKYFEAPKQI